MWDYGGDSDGDGEGKSGAGVLLAKQQFLLSSSYVPRTGQSSVSMTCNLNAKSRCMIYLPQMNK